jgi:RNA polymerase sigma-70 factor (ECF subfamily)
MDKNIFDAWYKDYRLLLLARARKIINDNHAAEDIVQNTFVSAWKSIENFDDNCKPLPWLDSILKRRAIDYIRLNFGNKGFKKHISIDKQEPEYYHENIDKDIPRDLQNAIDSLQKDIKKTFLMITLDGGTHQEIANKLNVPLGTVLSRVSRAKNHIKKYLQEVN